jgi:hypothetical protein
MQLVKVYLRFTANYIDLESGNLVWNYVGMPSILVYQQSESDFHVLLLLPPTAEVHSRYCQPIKEVRPIIRSISIS